MELLQKNEVIGIFREVASQAPLDLKLLKKN